MKNLTNNATAKKVMNTIIEIITIMPLIAVIVMAFISLLKQI